jgi:hypothetical protein
VPTNPPPLTVGWPHDPTAAAPPTPQVPVPPAPAPVDLGPAPATAAIKWYQSQRFIALCQSTVLLILGWLIAALSSNDWAWRAISISVVGNIVIVLKDWWNPNITAPFAALNKNNVA